MDVVADETLQRGAVRSLMHAPGPHTQLFGDASTWKHCCKLFNKKYKTTKTTKNTKTHEKPHENSLGKNTEQG